MKQAAKNVKNEIIEEENTATHNERSLESQERKRLSALQTEQKLKEMIKLDDMISRQLATLSNQGSLDINP